MPIPATADELLEVLRRSRAVEESRLADCLKRIGADALPATAGELSDQLVEAGCLNAFQARRAKAGKPLKLGPYRILDQLGIGDDNPVYYCQHMGKGDYVAIKVLTESKAHDAVALQRFYREARAGTRLDHPNLVRVFDSDWEGDTHYLVMEYVDGASLADIVKKSGPMPVARAAHYIRQAAQGLQFAHEHGLVHRDLKPDNLLVDRTGVVKILDMGQARFAQEDAEVLTQGVVLGAPEYAAPEQAVDSHNVDIRADIYALGATFYFLLTGKPPYGEEKSPAQKLLAKQTRPPTPVRDLRPEAPHEIDVLIQIMMAQQPSVRYGTPKEVVDALAKWTRGQSPAPTAEELPPRRSPAEPAKTPTPVEVKIDSDTEWKSLPEPEEPAAPAEMAAASPADGSLPDSIPLVWQIATFVALGAITFVVAWLLVLK